MKCTYIYSFLSVWLMRIEAVGNLKYTFSCFYTKLPGYGLKWGSTFLDSEPETPCPEGGHLTPRHCSHRLRLISSFWACRSLRPFDGNTCREESDFQPSANCEAGPVPLDCPPPSCTSSVTWGPHVPLYDCGQEGKVETRSAYPVPMGGRAAQDRAIPGLGPYRPYASLYYSSSCTVLSSASGDYDLIGGRIHDLDFIASPASVGSRLKWAFISIWINEWMTISNASSR